MSVGVSVVERCVRMPGRRRSYGAMISIVCGHGQGPQTAAAAEWLTADCAPHASVAAHARARPWRGTWPRAYTPAWTGISHPSLIWLRSQPAVTPSASSCALVTWPKCCSAVVDIRALRGHSFRIPPRAAEAPRIPPPSLPDAPRDPRVARKVLCGDRDVDGHAEGWAESVTAPRDGQRARRGCGRSGGGSSAGAGGPAGGGQGRRASRRL